jgi:hypothetical protein
MGKPLIWARWSQLISSASLLVGHSLVGRTPEPSSKLRFQHLLARMHTHTHDTCVSRKDLNAAGVERLPHVFKVYSASSEHAPRLMSFNIAWNLLQHLNEFAHDT